MQISTSENDLINKTLNLPFQQMLQSSYLKEHVKKALDELVKDDLDFVSESAFPSLSPHLFIYKLIMTNERDYRRLLGKINEIYRDLRRNLPPKKRLYLGFSHGDNRRSSPLYIRPIKFSEDDAFKILLFLFKNEIPDPDFEELFNSGQSFSKESQGVYPYCDLFSYVVSFFKTWSLCGSSRFRVGSVYRMPLFTSRRRSFAGFFASPFFDSLDFSYYFLGFQACSLQVGQSRIR